MATKPKKSSRAAGAKNLGGRPELSDEDRRDKLIRVLANVAEYQELEGAAVYVGLGVSTWLRVVGLERARALAVQKEAARDRGES